MKIISVGDASVGKTSLYNAYTTGKPYSAVYTPTVFENHSMHATLDGLIKYILNLRDTSGLEDYDRLRPIAYLGADAALVVFSLVSPISFKNVPEKWIPELRHYCADVKFLLVGMKSDLPSNPEVVKRLYKEGSKPVEYDEGLQLSENIGAERYIECSSVTMEGVHDVFTEAMRIFPKPKEPEQKSCVIF
ncbi:unnamed protein product [Clavelina lepadiformis]